MKSIHYKSIHQNDEFSLETTRKSIWNILLPKYSNNTLEIPEIIFNYMERMLNSTKETDIDFYFEELNDNLKDLSPDSGIEGNILNNLFQAFSNEQGRNISNYYVAFKIFIMLNRFSCFYEFIDSNQLNLYELANIKEFDNINDQYIVSEIFGLLLKDESLPIDYSLTHGSFLYYSELLRHQYSALQHFYNRIIVNTSIISNRICYGTPQNEIGFIIEMVALVFEPILWFIRNFPADYNEVFSILDGILTKGFDLMLLYEDPLLLQMINDSLVSTNKKELFNILSIIDKILMIRSSGDALAFIDKINCYAIINLLEPEVDEIQSILIHMLTVFFALDNLNDQNYYHMMFQEEKGVINNILYQFEEYPICTRHDIINLLSQLVMPLDEFMDSKVLGKISDFLSARMNEKDLGILYDFLRKLMQQYPKQISEIVIQLSQDFWESIKEEFPDAANSFNESFINKIE